MSRARHRGFVDAQALPAPRQAVLRCLLLVVASQGPLGGNDSKAQSIGALNGQSQAQPRIGSV